MRIKEINEEGILFDNGYKLIAYHEQDCCENVYADFEILKTYNVSTRTGKSIKIQEIDFNENLEELIQGIKEQGFNMVSKIEERFFVPCYNEQNGYYSNNLELILYKNNNIKEILDITDWIKDEIF